MTTPVRVVIESRRLGAYHQLIDKSLVIADAMSIASSPPTPASDTKPTAGAGSPGPLTRHEREVAILFAQGLSNRAIASRLFISERTAETHVQHIFTKLGLEARTQVAAWAAQRGLMPTDTGPTG